MDIKLKHRLVGACVILALAVFFLPLILDSEKYRSEIETHIPVKSTLQSEETIAPETSKQGSLTINLDEDEPEKAITEEENPVKSPAQSQEKEAVTNQEPAKASETDKKSAEPASQVELDEADAINNADTSSERTAKQGKTAQDSLKEESNSQVEQETEITPTQQATPTQTTPPQTIPTQTAKEPAKKGSVKNDPVPKKKAPKFTEQAWVIQIGSFSNKDNATKLVSDLRTQGYRAYERDSDEYSKVYVGPYPDKKAADDRQQGLEEIIGTPVKIIEFDAQAH